MERSNSVLHLSQSGFFSNPENEYPRLKAVHSKGFVAARQHFGAWIENQKVLDLLERSIYRRDQGRDRWTLPCPGRAVAALATALSASRHSR
ncbi:hypothetical protein BQ8482_310139 [Mesorhizobium delmotii]|uniref:Uncharacterized protein n=1 Tax=Mesorhizobium delmotii TaxID=1631247 RepID=A0A2P9ANU4_9HYPH|nr:hypothetical protein BQ8482_310139 [Mesorhizobium delmotii]